MSKAVHPADPGFFAVLSRARSLSAAARELGISTAAVSKHLAGMEERLGVPLVNRTTRRMSLTPDGEVYLAHTRRILGEIDELEQALGLARTTPTGLLRVNATLGFGRSHVAPMISKFTRRHPGIEVQLQLTVNPPPLTEDSFDVCVRFGVVPDARIIARHLAANRRLMCAAPSYLARHGEPQTPEDLMQHNCITIRQGNEAYGQWRLTSRGRKPTAHTIKVRGNLSTNDGGIAVAWALDGHGILMRAEWDIAQHLRSGRLVQVLPQYDTPDADIHAVYPSAHQTSRRVRVFVDFLAESFAQRSAV